MFEQGRSIQKEGIGHIHKNDSENEIDDKNCITNQQENMEKEPMKQAKEPNNFKKTKAE